MEELFEKINDVKQKIEDNRKERSEHYLIIQDLDNEYFKLIAILIDLYKQIKHDGKYKL